MSNHVPLAKHDQTPTGMMGQREKGSLLVINTIHGCHITSNSLLYRCDSFIDSAHADGVPTHYRIEMSKIRSMYHAILTMNLQERYLPHLTDESVVAQYSKVLCLGPKCWKVVYPGSESMSFCSPLLCAKAWGWG